MLVRRLLLLIAVLLVVGAIASAIAPHNSTRTNATTTTTGPGAPPTVPSTTAGATVTAELPGPATGRTKTVRARVGDLIDQTVRAPGPDTVTIAGYDEIQPADATSPAHFSFFADQSGTFDVSLQEAGTVAGRLEIERPA
jgi:hypothetical protein